MTPASKLASNRAYYRRNRARVRAKQAAYQRTLSQTKRASFNARNRTNYHARRVHQPWENLLSKARARAKKKKVPCNLTAAWVAKRWKGTCELTGIKFETAAGTPTGMSASIDRIVPSKGYVVGNCRLVLFCVNAFKGSMTDKQMRTVARRLCRD